MHDVPMLHRKHQRPPSMPPPWRPRGTPRPPLFDDPGARDGAPIWRQRHARSMLPSQAQACGGRKMASLVGAPVAFHGTRSRKRPERRRCADEGPFSETRTHRDGAAPASCACQRPSSRLMAWRELPAPSNRAFMQARSFIGGRWNIASGHVATPAIGTNGLSVPGSRAMVLPGSRASPPSTIAAHPRPRWAWALLADGGSF